MRRAPLLDLLDANRIFDVLDPSVVRREAIVPLEPVRMRRRSHADAAGDARKGSAVSGGRGCHAQPEPGPNYAALLQANGRSVIVAPACAEITDAVRRQLRRPIWCSSTGRLFTDDEMIAAGLGQKTGRRMGHVPVSGPGGTLEGLADLPCRRILIHINNTNPILLAGLARTAAGRGGRFRGRL